MCDKTTHAHVITCLRYRCLFLFCLLPLPLAPLLSLSLSTCSLSRSSTSMSSEPPRIKTTAFTHDEEYCPVATHNPLTESDVTSARVQPPPRGGAVADSENFYFCESWRHEVPAGDPRGGARGYCGSDRAGGFWLQELSKKAFMLYMCRVERGLRL